jgi:hypothetical protein
MSNVSADVKRRECRGDRWMPIKFSGKEKRSLVERRREGERALEPEPEALKLHSGVQGSEKISRPSS